MREIGFDKIGFNVLADTNDVCYAVSLKSWQLEEDKTLRGPIKTVFIFF